MPYAAPRHMPASKKRRNGLARRVRQPRKRCRTIRQLGRGVGGHHRRAEGRSQRWSATVAECRTALAAINGW